MYEEQLHFFDILDENSELWFSRIHFWHMDRTYVPNDWPPRWEYTFTDRFFYALDRALQFIYDRTINVNIRERKSA